MELLGLSFFFFQNLHIIDLFDKTVKELKVDKKCLASSKFKSLSSSTTSMEENQP
jgi:hypothetical protein